MRVDVQAIDCDFYVFSGHKVFAPTGIGVVYGKPEVLENMPPCRERQHDPGRHLRKDAVSTASTALRSRYGNIADASALARQLIISIV